MKVFLLLVCLLVLFVTSCSEADSKGGEPVEEVVITGVPSWSNGIGTLINKKCAHCHTVPSNELTPNNSPTDLDLRTFEGGNGVRAANSLDSWIALGILSQDIGNIRRMPLDYSTPLTEREIGYLQTWQQLGLPE